MRSAIVLPLAVVIAAAWVFAEWPWLLLVVVPLAVIMIIDVMYKKYRPQVNAWRDRRLLEKGQRNAARQDAS